MTQYMPLEGHRTSARERADVRHALAAALASAAVLAVILVLALTEVAFFGGVFRYREDPEVRLLGGTLLVAWSVSAVGVAGTLGSGGRVRSVSLVTALLLRATLVLAIVFMFVFPFLSQLEGKSMLLRAAVFPVMVLIVPVAYLWRGRTDRYPWAFDAAWSFTFVFDIVSNDLHWYGTWRGYDDFVHFVNGFFYIVAIAIAVRAIELTDAIRVGSVGTLLVAFLVYSACHAAWEMWEHYADVFLDTNLQPGGMAEASANTLWSYLAIVPATGLLWWWRRARMLDREVVAPLARLLGNGSAGSARAAAER